LHQIFSNLIVKFKLLLIINTELPDDRDSSIIDSEKEISNDQDNVLEILPPKESTAPIPLVHVSNSSDNSKEEAWFDEDMFFNEANPTKVNTTTSDDDDMYFDEINEEVPSGPDNTHDGRIQFMYC
jgi:hypothetical protein